MAEESISDLDPRLQKQVQNARQASGKGNAQYAIDICMDILKRHPECSDVREVLHQARLKKIGGKSTKGLGKFISRLTAAPFTMKADKQMEEDPLGVIEQAEKLLNQNPMNVPALRTLAGAALKADLPKTAVIALESATKIAPDDDELKMALGDAYLKAERPDQAVTLCQDVLQRNSANEHAQELIRRASVAIGMKKGRMEEEGDFRKGLKSEDEAAELEQASRAVHDEDTLKRLIERTKKKVEEEPDNINHYRDIASHFRKLHQPENALEWIRKARQLPSGKGDTTLERAEYDLELMALRQTIEQLEAQLQDDPENSDLKKQLDDKKAELHHFRLRNAAELVEKYPNDYGYRYEYGVLLLEEGEYDKAIQQLQLAQRNPKVRIDAMLNLGRVFKAKKIYDLAAETLSEAKNDVQLMNDTKKEIIYELALVYEAQDKTKEAIDEFKQIYANDISFRDVAEKINAYYERSAT